MARPAVPPFQSTPLLSNLYHAPDLLDLSAPGPSSPPGSSSTSPQPAATSIFSSATSIAAAAGRRAAAAAGSPSARAGTSTPERSAESRIEVRCVEGYGSNLYIGRSDGIVEWWVCDPSGSSSTQNGWSLRHRHTLFPRRAVQKIVLLPKVARAFVLSEGTLHPLTLPHLDVVPSTVIQPLRGVVSVVLDDDELEWDGPASESQSAEMTVVVVRRKGLGIYRLGNRLVAQKEIPLPSPPKSLALASRFLCAALPSSGTYSMIDLSDASLTEVLPVSQVDVDTVDFEPGPNVVVIPGENEFLVTSFTGMGAIGVFLNGQGDPVRGTLQWPEHPMSIVIESGFIIALLRNQTVSVHSLSDLETPVQVIALDNGSSAYTLSYSPYGISIRDNMRDKRMTTSRMLLLSDKLAPIRLSRKGSLEPELSISQDSAAVEATSPSDDPPSGSGLTPPSTPPPFAKQPIPPHRSSSLLRQPSASRSSFSTALAETLIVGLNGIEAISPTSAIAKVEQFCEERSLEEAIAVVDSERRKGRRGEIDGDKSTHQATLRFLHLYLATHLLLETNFEKAGEYFHRGKVDPRLLVRLFTAFRGKVIGSAEDVEIYDGLRGVLGEMPDIDQIIATSISRNYSPHVSPSTSRAPETVELHNALEGDAKAMLTEFLRKTRQSRRKGGARGADSRKIDIVIDTTLAKLLADAGTTNELLALLAGRNDVVLSELEPFLGKRPYVLATVLRQQGKVERVLQLLQEIAESDEPDPLCEDPIDEIAQQLESVDDPDLFRKHVLWLIKRDSEKGLAILMAQHPKSGMKLDDATMVEEIGDIDGETANRYLEHVVVSKRNPSRKLHEEVLSHLFDRVKKELESDGVRYHLEELDAEYRLSSDSQPFVIFLADIAPPSPIKSLRLKLILFLQGSPFYDLSAATVLLEDIPQLKTELAVVLGRQGQNRWALNLLARDIGDFISAQTYCTQGGEIVPPRIAHIVAGHVPEVVGWATLGEVGRRRRGTVDSKTQQGLVKDLLGVYMQEGGGTAKQAAALLNAQSVHLDVMKVLDLMPGEWPLDVVSTFLQRALRRELHQRATAQVLKSISAGQNLQTSVDYLDALSAIPPTVVSGSHSSSLGGRGMSIPDEGSIAEKEDGFLEKDVSLDSTDRAWEEGKEKGTEYFSPKVVEKELKELKELGVERLSERAPW